MQSGLGVHGFAVITNSGHCHTMSIECLSAGILVVDHLCDPIARLPAAGELLLSERLPLSIGGCAANVAVDLARVNVRVAAVGCVGKDPFGRFVIDTLKSAGVATEDIRELDDAQTSGTLIVNVRGEDRRYIHCPGANAVMTTADISYERIRQAKVFYVGGYLLMPALEGPNGLAQLFERARADGVTTVLDVVSPGPGNLFPRLADVLRHTDIFLPNDHEAETITGLKDPLEQAKAFREAGAATVVITQGERGTLLVNDKLRVHAGVYPTQYVGGTGAGDAFDAGYITGLLAGEDPIGCLKWGSALGASCVRGIGATDSVFNRQEALEFMKQHSLRIERV